MKMICPICEKETRIENIEVKENISIRGEEFSVLAKYQKCTECNGEFENTRAHDALAIAYVEYRKKHGMLQPEEIRKWRKGYGLTQKELGDLVGFGGATLSRYENGALQADSHERLLRLIMEPRNLLRLIKETPGVLGKDKLDRLIKELISVDSETCSFERVYEELLGNYSPDEFSGYKSLDIAKFCNVILYLCKGGQLKTKLNKLLFYVDFKHFKEYTVSITGAKYAHLPHGPVPDNYEHFFANLIHNEGSLAVDEVLCYEYEGENYTAVKEPNLSTFKDSELKILTEVKEFFKDYNARQIKLFSHEEQGYRETKVGQLISYDFARVLRL
jgi:putative zinc finger/helix-turn-helix YgiT family protein